MIEIFVINRDIEKINFGLVFSLRHYKQVCRLVNFTFLNSVQNLTIIIVSKQMRNTISFVLLFAIFACLLRQTNAEQNPIDIINSRHYEGRYLATQQGHTFGYLEGKEGRMIAIFYGNPNRDIINSLKMFFLDPRYEDSRMVIVDINQILNVDAKAQWVNNSHQVTITSAWKQRQQDSYDLANVSTSIKFMNLEQQDYEAVQIQITMKGENFELSATLTYYNQIVTTLSYCIYVSALVGIQIYSGYMLVKIMDAPNFVFTAKMSLLTLSLCNIEDFSQTMSHIQYIMGTSSGYLFFILPAIAYIILFIILDMKMLFLVWRSNNMRNMQNPQLLRKRLTAFYIQFYMGLFIYLSLTYFFENDEWMIILRNLILIPQIIHNIRLGNNPGFNKHYIFGFVGSRMLLPIYQRLCPSNRFALTPNVTLVIILIGLFMLQVTLLYLQSRLGSRFFVPKRFQPNYFNYRYKMKRDDSNKQLECSICLQNLFDQAPNERNTSVSNSSQLQLEQPFQKQVSVMNTPCNHKFHEQCLTQWMEVKLECPSCRAVLPPN